MKRSLAALLLSAAAVAILTAPAGAAVPKTKPTYTVPCGHGSKKAAEVWAEPDPRTAPDPVNLTHLAATNPCKQWLSYSWYIGTESSGYGTTTWYLRPGAHFNWWDTPGVSVHGPLPAAAFDTTLGLGPLPKCVANNGGDNVAGLRIDNYKTMTQLPNCP